MSFRNPKKDSTFYIRSTTTRQRQVHARSRSPFAIGDQAIDELHGRRRSSRTLVTFPVTAAQFGSGRRGRARPRRRQDVRARRLVISRELGIRVFHAFVEPK